MNKVKKLLYNYKGFLSKKDGWIDYVELHAFGIGVIDGFGVHGEGYRLDYWRRMFEDVKDEPQYYHFGYAVGRAVKYLGVLAVTGSAGVTLF